MRSKFQLKLFLLFVPFAIQAQDVREIDIPVDEICRMRQLRDALKKKEIGTECTSEQNKPSLMSFPNLDEILKTIKNDKVGRTQTWSEFCENLDRLKKEQDNKIQDMLFVLDEYQNKDDKKIKTKWIYRISFGPGFSRYSRADLQINAPTFRGEIKDIHWDQRNSMDYYNVVENIRDKDKNFLQFLDEPSNNIMFEAENKDKYLIGIRLYHPKMVARAYDKDSGDDIKAYSKNTSLQIDAETKDGNIQGKRDLKDFFWNIELTTRIYTGEVYVNKIFPIIPKKKKSKWGALNLQAGVSAGFYGGFAKNNYIISPEAGDPEGKNPWKVIGYTLGVNQRLSYSMFNQRIELSVVHNLNMSSLKFKMIDGEAKIPRLISENLSMVLSVDINTGLNKKIKDDN